MATDAELIRMIENRVRSRCMTHLFREKLWQECLSSSNPIVVAGGHAYRASNDLAELCVSDARARLQQAAALMATADINDSPLIAWWTLDLDGDAAEEALDGNEAYRLFSQAATFAERHGLAEPWIRSLINQIYLLQQMGRSRELVGRVRELVETETFMLASILKAGTLADVLAWIGQPGLSALAQGQAAEDFAEPVQAAVAEAYIAEGNLDAAEEAIKPDLLRVNPPQLVDPQAHATHLLVALDLRIRQGQIEKAAQLAEITATFLSTRDSATHNNALRIRLAQICLRQGKADESLGHLACVNDEQAKTDQRLNIAEIYAADYRALERWTEAAHWYREQIERSKHRSLSALTQAEIINILVSSEFASSVSGPVEKRLAELRATVVEREAMTSVVAKDLRGPIFALELATTMSESAPSDRVSELMTASQTTLELVISELTDLDYLESFEASGPATELEASELVTAGVEMARPVLRGGTVNIEFPSGRRRPKVFGHGPMLTRVVAYAIVDVASHMPNDTDLRLTVGEFNNVVTITIQSIDAEGPRQSALRASSPATGREQFVLKRIVHLIGGHLVDSSTSDSDRLIRLTLPSA